MSAQRWTSPLHGWIESVIFLFGSRDTRHRSMTVVTIVHLLATRFRQVTPSSPRCWSQQSRISAPDSSCGHTSTPRHESCCRNGQPRRWSTQRPKSLQKEPSDSFDDMLLPTSRIMRATREKILQTSQRPRVLHHSQLYRRLRWRQKHGGLLCHRKCLARA